MIELLEKIQDERKIICFSGGMGSGKTLAMSYFANELKEELKNAKIYSNYELSFGHKLTDFMPYELGLTDEYTIICIDEGDNFFSFSPTETKFLFSDVLKNKKLILLFTFFKTTRVKSAYRKEIDLVCQTEKNTKQEIEVTFSPLPYSRKIKIKDSNIFYQF